MSLPAVQVTPELEAYMLGLVPAREPVLARMEEESTAEGIPAVGPQVGGLLRLLARLARPTSVLELGAAIGYSAIWILRGAEGARLTTLETDPERARRARANLEAAGLGDRAQVIEEDAIKYLERERDPLGLCFNDLLNAFESEDVVERCFHLCRQRLLPGGLLIADNALRRGEVAEPESRQARNVARYNRLVADDRGLESVLLPLRDGVSVARKLS